MLVGFVGDKAKPSQAKPSRKVNKRAGFDPAKSKTKLPFTVLSP